MKKTKLLIMSCILGTSLLASTSIVFAKTDSILTKDASGNSYQYSLKELSADAVKHELGLSSPLYDEYITRTVVAFHDDKTGYIDSVKVNGAATTSAANNKTFDIDAYTEAESGDAIVTPTYPIHVRGVEDGKTVIDLSVTTTVDKKVLKDEISIATATKAAATVGTTVGCYAQADVDVLDAAIKVSQAVVDNKDTKQADVDAAVTDLKKAEADFATKAVKITIVPVAIGAATANNSKTVIITLSEAAASISADGSQFAVKDSSNNTVTVAGAVLAEWDTTNKTVLLSLAADTTPETEYTVTNGTTSAKFVAKAADTQKPSQPKISPTANTEVTVTFDEEVKLTGATFVIVECYGTKANLNVASIKYGSDGKTLILTTSPQKSSTLYSINISGVQDLSGNTIEATKVTFVGKK